MHHFSAAIILPTVFLPFFVVGSLAASSPTGESGTGEGMWGGASPAPVRVADREVLSGRLPLREVIGEALARKPGVEVRRLAVDSALLETRVADAAFDPVLRVSGEAADNRQPQAASELDGAQRPQSDSLRTGMVLEQPLRDGSSVELGFDPLDRRGTNSTFSQLNPSYDSSLQVTYRLPLLRGGREETRLPGERARIGVLRAEDEWVAELEDLVGDVEAAYWTVRLSESVLAFRRRALDVARLTLEETIAAEGTRTDVLEARSQVMLREVDLAAAEKGLEDALDELFLASGLLFDSDPGRLELDPLPQVDSVAPDSGEMFEQALERGTEARAQQWRLELAALDVIQTRSEARPSLDFRVSGGAQGRGGDFGSALQGMREVDGRFLRGGLEFRMPLGLRAERAREAQAELRFRTEELEVDDARLALYARIRGWCRDLDLAVRQLERAEAAIELNETRLAEQQERRRQGAALVRDILEAQESLDDAFTEKLRAQLDIIRARLELDAARGALLERHGILSRFSTPSNPSDS